LNKTIDTKKGLFLCKKSSIINESCAFDNDCKNDANLVCNQDKCICNEYTTHWSYSHEKCERHYGEEGCLSNKHCEIGFVCNITAGKRVCMCPYLNDSQQYLNTLTNICSIRMYS
jgi:hypothetical protein